jgi:hypothetical protein
MTVFIDEKRKWQQNNRGQEKTPAMVGLPGRVWFADHTAFSGGSVQRFPALRIFPL